MTARPSPEPAGTPADTPVLVVGEALVDVVTRPGGVSEHPGGSPANVAAGLGRLGHPVELATHLADDAHGHLVAEHLRAHGVRIHPGSMTATRTSTATAGLDEAGGAGSSAYRFDLTWQLPDLTGLHPAHVHTGSIAATLEPGASGVLALVQDRSPTATVSYDPNTRPTLMGAPHDVRSRIEEVIGRSDVVKASDEDIDWLYAGAPVPEVLRLWGVLGPAVLVVTHGGEGAAVAVPGTGEAAMVAAPAVRPVDTVGAGDSFMAGLLSGLIDAGLLGGREARQRLRTAGLDAVRPAVDRGLATAAWTVARAGAAAPSRAELGLPDP